MPVFLASALRWLGIGAVFGIGQGAVNGGGVGGTVANAVKPDWTKIGIIAIIAIVVLKKL